MPVEKTPMNNNDSETSKLTDASEPSSERSFMPGPQEHRDVEERTEKLNQDLKRSILLERRKKIVTWVLLIVVILLAGGYYLSLEPGSELVPVVKVFEEITTDIPAENSVEKSAEEDVVDIMDIEDPFEAIIRADMMREADMQQEAESYDTTSVADDPGRKYAVQVGAFKVESNALKFAEKLRSKGYEVSVLPLKFKNGKLMHRLLVGRFGSEDRALEELQRLTEKEGLDGLFVTPL